MFLPFPSFAGNQFPMIFESRRNFFFISILAPLNRVLGALVRFSGPLRDENERWEVPPDFPQTGSFPW